MATKTATGSRLIMLVRKIFMAEGLGQVAHLAPDL